MCLIVVGHCMHPDYPLVLAANRDEYYQRPTVAADFWAQAPEVLAGRDLQGGGTWLGVTRQGRWAALTNVRGAGPAPAGHSRGLLVSGFLRSTDAPQRYLARVARWGHRFAGFNLLAGDCSEVASFSNRDTGVRLLTPGCYGLSNHLLDSPWPKVEQAKEQFKAVLARPGFKLDLLWPVLSDRQLPNTKSLPETGLDPDLERALGAIFVQLPGYGTRCSTLVAIGRDGHIRMAERRYASDGRIEGESRFAFNLVS